MTIRRRQLPPWWGILGTRLHFQRNPEPKVRKPVLFPRAPFALSAIAVSVMMVVFVGIAGSGAILCRRRRSLDTLHPWVAATPPLAGWQEPVEVFEFRHLTEQLAAKHTEPAQPTGEG